MSNAESRNAYKFDENYYVILPDNVSEEVKNKYEKLPKVAFTRYQSDDELMAANDIEQILKKADIITK